MITSIKEFKKYNLLINESVNTIYDTFIQELKKYNIEAKKSYNEIIMIIENTDNNEIRLDRIQGYLSVEMIYLDEKIQRKGYGEKIYKAVLNTCKHLNYKGLYSPAFDMSSGQQRSISATNLLLKLCKTYKNNIIDITNEIDNDYITDIIHEGIPHYGPPYLDIYIYSNINESKDLILDKETLEPIDSDEYEIASVVDIITDQEEILKIEQKIDRVNTTNFNYKQVDKNDVIWLTVMLKPRNNSIAYQMGEMGVIQCKVLQTFYGLGKLKQLKQSDKIFNL